MTRPGVRQRRHVLIALLQPLARCCTSASLPAVKTLVDSGDCCQAGTSPGLTTATVRTYAKHSVQCKRTR